MDRRSFLRAGLALSLGGAATLAGAPAAAAPRAHPAPRLRAIRRGRDGVTFELSPASAPYPVPGGAFTDSTVLAFVPGHLRVRPGARLDVLVFFHGHGSTAREALARQRLAEQLVESRQNAILVVPQGPVRAATGDFGKLMLPGGLGRLLGEVRELLGGAAATSALGKSATSASTGVGRVAVAAHSGGYRAAAAAVSVSGADVREVWLFDALYGEADAFRRWLLAAPSGRKLVSFAVAGEPLRESLALAAALRARGVRVLEETPRARLSRADLARARAVVARPAATHATATFAESALLDCLVSSCFRGVGSEGFWTDADEPRAITRRES